MNYDISAHRCQNPQIAHQVLAEENSIVPPMTTCTDCTEINGEIDDEKCNCSVIDKEQKDPEQQDQSNWEVLYDSEVTDQPIVSCDVGLETAFSQQLQISHQGVPP
ncbi:hypothetical protein HCN44_004735 [Aphidius gifuensis]|uniref:Uncharacterized protein n=1 Tax=Aphidius gifuensis TaxID=684658 RepID=A0A834XXE2_APHGI|nr:hypothetical protein HCN44_004735 [Aphidius gifuensis]